METNTQIAQITVADLVAIKQLIELGFSRGTYRADEAATVGEIYNKLTLFLDSIINTTPETNEDNSPE